MNRLPGILAVASLAIALPSIARAQAAPTPVTVTIMAGAALPMSDLDNVYNLGYDIIGGVEFAPRMVPFGVRGEIGYTRLSAETIRMSDPDLGDVTIKPKWSNLSFLLNAVLGPTVPAAQIRPYAVAGVGYYQTSEGGTFKGNLGGEEFDVSGSESQGSVGFNGGAGVRFQFVGFASFIEARYHHVLKGEMAETDDPNAPTRWKSAGYLPINFGISLGGR